MRFVQLSLAAVALLSSGAEPPQTPRAKAARTPILVELFTSEGCSSCPAADAALARLVRDQPLENVLFIGLEEHVDYWNNLGWADPFSAPRFTQRQEQYLAAVGRDGMFTPQAVIDGRTDAIGSDREAIVQAARGAVAEPHGVAAVRVKKKTGESFELEASAAQLPAGAAAQLWVALVEDGIATQVLRGENAGKSLPHAGVVRAMVRVAEGMETLAGTATIPIGVGWKLEALRAVVFAQDAKTKHVLAAGM